MMTRMAAGNLIVSIVCWAIYFGLTVGVILLDRYYARQRALAQGTVDFMDRSPTTYLVLALFCGPAPLIVYFGVTRKSALGWLMGIGAAVGVYAVTFFAAFIMSFTIALASHAAQ